jgi:MFS family permease
VEVAKSAEIEFSARQALRTRSFWLLTLAITASGAGLSVVMVHIMPFLESVEVSRGVASSVAALVAVISVVGRLGFGWLGDRWEKRHLLAIAFLLQAIGLLFFAYTQALWPAIVFLMLFGPGFGGTITLRLALQGDYFGRKAFASIQGMMLGIYLMGHMVSPVFAGWVFDVQGSYRLAWIALALITFIAIPITLALRPPSPKTNAERALQ